ncbi:hypothetical protein [Microbulbifer sp. SH-1]|uniref:hypothetical protein n=1 Tax=Microbulbifer sp. SH-1 TaxID=2681547 RepID=UPI00197B103A|nr:hypothetical protein [Microbulbifer sp. SH-1]
MGALFDHFKHGLSATLIGVRRAGEQKIAINPALNENVAAGDTLYYIAAERLPEKRCFDVKITEREALGECLTS